MIKDWEFCKIENISKTSSGGTPNRKILNYYKGKIRWFTTSELSQKYLYDSNEHITEKAIENSSAKLFKKETILLAMYGATIGKVSILKADATTNQACCAIMPYSNYFNEYIYYQLVFNKKNLINLGCGAGQPNISQKIIKDFSIICPKNKDEQIKIATVLSNIDLLIHSLEKLIGKKKLIKQGVMQELLTGKKRLPGFNGKWVKKELQELGDFTSGGVDKKSIPGQKSVKLLNFLDVYHRDFIFKNELYHIVTASDAQIKKCTLKKGDLFFTPSSELQTDLALSAVVMEDCPGCVYSYHITRFRFKDNFDIKFKSYMFNNKEFSDQASLIAEGSGKRYVVNLSKFKTLTITYPTDIKEQTSIAEILWDLDQEINSLEKDLGKYKNIKQGMMEQLLTGKIRLIESNENIQSMSDKKHNQHFDDAVVFANIVASCYSPDYPLGRKKCQKMMYLFKRFNNSSVEQFGHYAAGPYDNKARYGGFETIAIKNKYVVENKSNKGSSFAPGPDIDKAKSYCSKYGYDKFIPIFNQYLKFKKVDELELYTTVDKTILELKEQNLPINLNTVKNYISNDKTWVPKLTREVFNDENIEEAIRFSQLILGV